MRTLAAIVATTVVVGALAGVRAQEQVFEAGPGITAPRPVKEVKPLYTPRAMEERVQGTVWLEVVVRTDGSPTDIQVTKALDQDLDKQAIAALEQWEFKPGTREGKPVPVRITVEMTFTLR